MEFSSFFSLSPFNKIKSSVSAWITIWSRERVMSLRKIHDEFAHNAKTFSHFSQSYSALFPINFSRIVWLKKTEIYIRTHNFSSHTAHTELSRVSCVREKSKRKNEEKKLIKLAILISNRKRREDFFSSSSSPCGTWSCFMLNIVE